MWTWFIFSGLFPIASVATHNYLHPEYKTYFSYYLYNTKTDSSPALHALSILVHIYIMLQLFFCRLNSFTSIIENIKSVC